MKYKIDRQIYRNDAAAVAVVEKREQTLKVNLSPFNGQTMFQSSTIATSFG